MDDGGGPPYLNIEGAMTDEPDSTIRYFPQAGRVTLTVGVRHWTIVAHDCIDDLNKPTRSFRYLFMLSKKYRCAQLYTASRAIGTVKYVSSFKLGHLAVLE